MENNVEVGMTEREIHAPGDDSAVTPARSTCPSCGGGSGGRQTSYVYAIGKIEARFPNLSLEKEFYQVASRASTTGLTDRQVLSTVLSQSENRYLARQMCWVFTIQNVDSYILTPRDPRDFDNLVAALRPAPSPMDLDVAIGIRGPMAPPEICNGLMAPIVTFDQVYWFDRNALLQSIPRPAGTADGAWEAAAAEVLDRILLMADNAGATDEHRALNYLVVRYPAIYAAAADAFARNCSLSAVEVRPAAVGGGQKIVDVIVSFTNRATDVLEQYFLKLNVSGEFPFPVTKLSPYYPR